MLAPLLFLALVGPGGPGGFAPDRDWDLQHVALDLKLDPEAGKVEGTATLTVAPMPAGRGELVLDQVGLDVRRVTAGGEVVPWTLSERDVRVTLGPRDGPVDVVVEYAATPRTGLHFRAPGPDSPDTYVEVWSQGEDIDNRHWLPLPDHPKDRFTVDARFTAPEGYRILSNGLGTREGDAWHYRMDERLVSYLIMVAAAPYQVWETTWRDRPVEVWGPPDASRAQLERVGASLPDMLDFFSDYTGVDYPFPTYREVYVQRFLYGGMENATATVIARKMLGDADAPIPGPRAEYVSAHELAHQWYGDLLTCRGWSEMWLNEGFAAFFGTEWLGHRYGEVLRAARIARTFDRARDVGPLSGRWWSTADGSHGDHDAVYVRGASVLRMLQGMLGDDAFRAAIQVYTRRHADGVVETEDLRRAFEDTTGRDLRWFFDQWVHLGGAPEVKVTQAWSEGQLTLALTQTPPDGRAPYAMPVTVELGGAEGPVRRSFWLDGPKVRLVVDLPEAPTYVAVDPDGALLPRISVEQSPAMWRAQAASASPYAVLRAIQHLGEGGASDESVDLLTALLRDPELPLRIAAIQALGELDDPQGNGRIGAVLLDHEADLEARIAAAEALGKGSGEGDVAALLWRGWAEARRADDIGHESLAAEVLLALRRHDRQGALREARQVLRRRPGRPADAPLHAAALEVLGDKGEPKDLQVVLRYLDGQSSSDLTHAALGAGQQLAERAPAGQPREDAKAQVARAAEGLLDDRFVRTRGRAIQVLGHVGDKQTIAALERFRRVETEPDLLKLADNALSTLRARGKGPAGEDARIDGRIEDLEARLDALSRQLEALSERR
ncbi:MAG: HEAT repeat domain-containing protein [Alphaproteobacteria bacterium]|nr:HEAT repeat domain-containing protein [Alphaproteobacteria bacterium]